MDIKRELPGIQKNVLLKNYTTFKIGGPAKYFFVAKTKKNLILAILVAKKLNLPFFILGGGSNILVADEEYKGLVIKLQIENFKLKNEKIVCEAGIPLAKLVQISIENNLTGLEWAIGIPGTLGGAIYGNAGAFGKSMGDLVRKVEIFDLKSKKIKIFKNRDCQFNYRESIFKKKTTIYSPHPRGQNESLGGRWESRSLAKRAPNLIILSAEILLKKGKKSEIKRKIKANLSYRKETQPLNFPSAGSVFKNPKGFSAAELIEKCNLKGKKIGNVKISEQHANFIVNSGKGKAKDVIKLIKLIKEKAKKKFRITLEEEIQYLSFES